MEPFPFDRYRDASIDSVITTMSETERDPAALRASLARLEVCRKFETLEEFTSDLKERYARLREMGREPTISPEERKLYLETTSQIEAIYTRLNGSAVAHSQRSERRVRSADLRL